MNIVLSAISSEYCSLNRSQVPMLLIFYAKKITTIRWQFQLQKNKRIPSIVFSSQSRYLLIYVHVFILWWTNNIFSILSLSLFVIFTYFTCATHVSWHISINTVIITQHTAKWHIRTNLHRIFVSGSEYLVIMDFQMDFFPFIWIWTLAHI